MDERVDEWPTEMVEGLTMAAPPRAWSAEGYAGEALLPYQRERWRKVGIAAVVGLSAAAVAGSCLVAWVVMLSGGDKPPALGPAPTSNAVATRPSPVPPPLPPVPETIDEKFVAALINHGAEITRSEIAVHNAHAVCDDLAHGTDRTLIANSIRDATNGYTDERAAIFVSLSALFYCPRYAA